jgi:response regulator RpfG family c-di-GMP phosphodiesterase
MGTNYKGKLSHEKAIEELKNEAGKQFDPALVEQFCEIFK